MIGRLGGVGVVGLALAAGLAACSGSLDSGTSQTPPIVFAPGLGMSALAVEVDGNASFSFLVPTMTSPELLPPPATSALDYSQRSGLRAEDIDRVHEWLALDISSEGRASNATGVFVAPVSVGENFLAECPQYVPMANLLSEQGWMTDISLKCLPYDYRYPPGKNSFATDLREVVEASVAAAGGTKAVIACHSQGCLMADHALRTLDPVWVADNVAALFGFAGQYSGCSDCMKWAFSQGWSWDPDAPDASPVDPTWVGQMALGLQSSVYGDNVLYMIGDRKIRAVDDVVLLQEGGAIAMARATERYALQHQEWFMLGDDSGVPLPVPARFVYGTTIPTTVGYAFDAVPDIGDQPDAPAIEADGDGGDSAWMNEAPARWTDDPKCDMQGLPGITHMGIVTDVHAVGLLATVARAGAVGNVPCLNP
jgi:hypothetical protein